MYNEYDILVVDLLEAHFLKMLNYPNISPKFKSKIGEMLDAVRLIRKEASNG